jgi:arylsulfatase A-like enzyme
VGFWAAPILSGSRLAEKPNIILYIIDGGGADYMSVYGYEHDTTPNLAQLAAEGAVFDRAYSNSSWTRPSTLSFLTSLQSSALGGLVNGRNIVPNQVPTLAEHMHRTGYQTAEFTTNSNAGSISGLDRGNDVFRESGVENYSTSSIDLHENYWAWRTAYPGEPYLAHFQTTDVHTPHTPTVPFSGRFIDPERRRLADEWTAGVEEIPETDEVRIGEALDLIGADRTKYWTAQRDLHDECMAHQDHQLGQLVSRLKEKGEWEHTLLIVAADHSVAAGSWDYELLTRKSELPHVYHDDPATPILRPGVSRIPLIVVWPGVIAPGQRFAEPVSLLDLLPTVLDLTELTEPDFKQGRSLAPLLLGETGWESQAIFFDEFEVDGLTQEIRGRIEVIDGRWGASLLINEDPTAHPRWHRPAPLLLYDLTEDPFCLNSVHEERPDLMERYTRLLRRQFKAHRDLGSLFEAGEQSPLEPAQLEMLRSLGYIQ